MSVFQSIINEIVAKRRDISENQIRDLIEQKKKELPGFLSDEGAARLVAEDLLIRTTGTELGRMQVKDLVSGLNDVSISGRILSHRPSQTFQRRDGTSGRVMRLVIVDKSGKARCVLWDRHVETVSKADNLQGSIIRIGHAYTRQGLANDIEVHAGERSSIEINPRGPVTDFPEFNEFFSQISKIPNESFDVNTVGVVQSTPNKHSFTKDGRNGSVLRTILADKSGTIPVVAWNEKADELQDLKRGDILQIINGRTKLDSNSRPELYIETRSQTLILTQAPSYLEMPIERVLKIAELTASNYLVNLEVRVIAKGDRRTIKRASGETATVSTLMVGDETGLQTISLWDDKITLSDSLQIGDYIRLRNVSIRDRMGELQLNLGKTGEIEKLATIGQTSLPKSKINALANIKNLANVEGMITDEPIIRQVSTQKGETIDVASFTLKDETGTTRVTLWREQVKLAKGLQVGTHLQLLGARVRLGLSGQMELNSVPLTMLKVISNPSDKT